MILDPVSKFYVLCVSDGTLKQIDEAGISTDYPPRWSPDGNYLAGLSKTHVFLVDAEKGEAHSLLEVVNGSIYAYAAPLWAPDSSGILTCHDNQVLLLPRTTNRAPITLFEESGCPVRWVQ